jgi:hypothetical protein
MPKKKSAATINTVTSKEIAATHLSVKENRGFNNPNNSSDPDDFSDRSDCKEWRRAKDVEPEKMQKIITDILAPISLKNFELDMKKIQFVGIATEKYYDDSLATTVQYFDYESGGIVNRIIDLPHYPKVKETSAERICIDLKKVINKYGLADKIVSYSAADEARFFGVQQAEENDQQVGLNLFL